jgi:hypothetical protein
VLHVEGDSRALRAAEVHHVRGGAQLSDIDQLHLTQWPRHDGESMHQVSPKAAEPRGTNRRSTTVEMPV